MRRTNPSPSSRSRTPRSREPGRPGKRSPRTFGRQRSDRSKKKGGTKWLLAFLLLGCALWIAWSVALGPDAETVGPNNYAPPAKPSPGVDRPPQPDSQNAQPVAPTPPLSVPSTTPPVADPWVAVDAYATSPAAEQAAARGTAALGEYLANVSPFELFKVRAIVRWLGKNIAYDVAALNGAPIIGTADVAPDRVLENRRSVCSGYSNLFKSLATAAGIEAVVVRGFSRNAPGVNILPGAMPNHAWNAVKIDGIWRLIDSTWYAGHVRDRQVFHAEIDEFWFLTDPSVFVLSHFPENPRWQLLPASLELSFDQFRTLPWSGHGRAAAIGIGGSSLLAAARAGLSVPTVGSGFETHQCWSTTAPAGLADGMTAEFGFIPGKDVVSIDLEMAGTKLPFRKHHEKYLVEIRRCSLPLTISARMRTAKPDTFMIVTIATYSSPTTPAE